MLASGKNIGSPHPLERFVAGLGALACLFITAEVWISVSSHQPMWPLPGLYFIELPLLCLVGAALFIRGEPVSIVWMWAAVGVLVAFCILGALSVGFLYVPTALLFAGASIASDVRNKRPVASHLAICLLAAVAQAALMLVAIRLVVL